MTRTSRHLTSLATLTMLAALAACEANNSVAPAPEPEPEPVISNTTLQLDFAYVEVIRDCDGIEGDGDFRFTVRALPSWAGAVTAHNASHTLGDRGRTAAIGRRTLVADAVNGQQVTVQFTASERDKNVFGSTYNDSRMDGLQRTDSHSYRNGSWTALGPRSITVGSGDCQVRLHYTATQVR